MELKKRKCNVCGKVWYPDFSRNPCIDVHTAAEFGKADAEAAFATVKAKTDKLRARIKKSKEASQ